MVPGDTTLLVINALREAATNACKLSDFLKAPKAVHFMRYGAARRLLMMWHSYRNIVVYTAQPDRVRPLSGDESNDLTRDLNVIYININGVLDNFAWSLLHERVPEKAQKLHHRDIGLFKPCITRDASFTTLAKVVRDHETWYREVTKRRDPVAHRIPLTVPPSVLSTPEETAAYQRLYEDHRRAADRLDFDGAARAMAQMEGIGRFSSCFMHDPAEGKESLYPTLPKDIGHVIELFEAVEKYLLG